MSAETVLRIVPYIVVIIVLVGGTIAFFKGEKKSLKDVLLYLCTEAERIYGSETGQLKLQYVWSQACMRFKFLTTFLTFETFSGMVNECLVNLRHLLKTNPNVAEYVGTKDNNTGGE